MLRPPPWLFLLLPLAAGPALAAPDDDPGRQCRAAIAAAERSHFIPAGLMAAIGRVESGRRAADGHVDPWPWSIDAAGSGQVFASKAAAIAAVRGLQAAGVRSVDVGCMQVNLLHHPDAFPSLDAAFDPAANADYAARFLTALHAATGDWAQAAALYHSATPALADDYRRKVLAAWPAERAAAGAAAPAELAVMPAAGGVLPGGGMPPRPFLHAGAGRPALAPGRPTHRSLAAYRAAPVAAVPGAGRQLLSGAGRF